VTQVLSFCRVGDCELLECCRRASNPVDICWPTRNSVESGRNVSMNNDCRLSFIVVMVNIAMIQEEVWQ